MEARVTAASAERPARSALEVRPVFRALKAPRVPRVQGVKLVRRETPVWWDPLVFRARPER